MRLGFTEDAESVFDPFKYLEHYFKGEENIDDNDEDIHHGCFWLIKIY
jgi:hypothetical protein